MRCPNCATSITSSMLSKVENLSDAKTAFINEFQETHKEGYCSKCGPKLLTSSKQKLAKELETNNKAILGLLKHMPALSTHSPHKWDYKALSIVTGQTSTGTGVVTEFVSDWTDLFGAQSGRHNSKIRAGEKMCLAQLRTQTLELGGNAIIAVDIDYSEIGSGRGIIMVCMTGTAIRLENVSEVLSGDKESVFAQLIELKERNSYLMQIGKIK